jgi:hypothetical protein
MNKYIYVIMMIGSSFVFSKEKGYEKPNGCEGVVLCPSSSNYGKPNDFCDYRWSVNLGLLYQQPWMSDMGAGTADIGQNIYQNNTSLYKNTTSNFLEECFEYSLGLTAGIGYFIDHDNWFLLVDLDWLSANIKNSYNNPGLIYHMAGFLNPNVGTTNSLNANVWNSIDTKADLDLYDLNFALSRGSFYSKCCSFEPFAGVKALWYNGSYQRRGYNDTILNTNSYLQSLQKYQAWGVGPSFGLNGEYFFTRQLSVFSDSSIALLYGGINTQTTSLYFDPSVNNDINSVATYLQSFKQPYFVPFRIILGLKFDKYFLENSHYIALKIGYDIRYVIGDAGLSGNEVNASVEGQNFKQNIMLYSKYNIAANGLYLNFIWNF